MQNSTSSKSPAGSQTETDQVDIIARINELSQTLNKKNKEIQDIRSQKMRKYKEMVQVSTDLINAQQMTISKLLQEKNREPGN